MSTSVGRPNPQFYGGLRGDDLQGWSAFRLRHRDLDVVVGLTADFGPGTDNFVKITVVLLAAVEQDGPMAGGEDLDSWDAQTYDRFVDERSRPLVDLLARVRIAAPRVVVDLGCGSGNGLSLMRRRWPEALLIGVDSSVDMLDAAAAEVGADEHISLVEADARSWTPDSPVDVVVCNALLQWVPEHPDLLRRMSGWLAPGGELALQVPGNFDAPSHVLLAQLAGRPQWISKLSGVLRGPESVLSPAGYFQVLSGSGSGAEEVDVDPWETTYLHVLSGLDPVLRWTSGTALRPILAALSDDDGAEFSRQYAELLRAAYPADSSGRVLFPFRRIFAVARM